MTINATAPIGVMYPDKSAHGVVSKTIEVTERGEKLTLAFFLESNGMSKGWVPLDSLIAEGR